MNAAFMILSNAVLRYLCRVFRSTLASRPNNIRRGNVLSSVGTSVHPYVPYVRMYVHTVRTFVHPQKVVRCIEKLTKCTGGKSVVMMQQEIVLST